MRRNMGKLIGEPIHENDRNKASIDFLIMCGVKSPEKTIGREDKDLYYENDELFLNTEFHFDEPMAVDDSFPHLKVELFRKYNIKDCYVKLMKLDDMLHDSDFEFDSNQSRKNESTHIICQYCNKVFQTLWKKNDHIVVDHREELTCDICLQFFKTPKMLQVHMKTHTTLNQCRLCSQCFSSTYLLDTHFLSKHAGINPFTCRYCSKQFSVGSALKRHEKSHRKRNPKHTLRCRYCNRFFEEVSHLKLHLQLNHDEKKLSCKFCGMKHSSHNSLTNHLLTHQAFECNKCGEKFLKKCYLRNHLKRGCAGEIFSDDNGSESQATLTCEYCCKRFVTQRNFNRHMATFHPEGDTYYCEECQTRFDTEDLLRKHIHIKCKLCDQSFSNIEIHMWKSHPTDSPYYCAVCGDAYSSVTRLRQHLKDHNDEFSCEYCFKTFGRGHQLEYHVLRSHVVEKSFTCELCEKSYPSMEILKEHKKIVHTEDSFECDFCKKRFCKFLLLEKHIMKLHSGGKSLQCDFCPKRFGSNALLKSHEKFHFMSYECIACGNVFKSSDCLKKHVGEVHASEEMKDEIFGTNMMSCFCCSKIFDSSDNLKNHIEEEHDSYSCITHDHNTGDAKHKKKQQSFNYSETVPVKEEYKEYKNATSSYEYCSNF